MTTAWMTRPGAVPGDLLTVKWTPQATTLVSAHPDTLSILHLTHVSEVSCSPSFPWNEKIWREERELLRKEKKFKGTREKKKKEIDEDPPSVWHVPIHDEWTRCGYFNQTDCLLSIKEIVLSGTKNERDDSLPGLLLLRRIQWYAERVVCQHYNNNKSSC